ncbi:glycosyltransferase family 2 protein [Paraburkholderia kirstenboschensis]|uniref:glycosyltransferase family 2 protein n=1 Tax=Paraburkholderia kirstenboschensis TaxID=1245436 RepID=UPI000B181AF8
MRVRYSESPPKHCDLLFSVVIANYNYGRFLRQAIESALTQDWPHIEIIVVDDGSTDDSADVIRSFGEVVTAIFQENGGQRVANNVGFARSSGDVVIFLDADDVLVPGALRSIASVWRTGLTKVQVLMERVDTQGRPIRDVIPKIRNVIPKIPPNFRQRRSVIGRTRRRSIPRRRDRETRGHAAFSGKSFHWMPIAIHSRIRRASPWLPTWAMSRRFLLLWCSIACTAATIAC